MRECNLAKHTTLVCVYVCLCVCSSVMMLWNKQYQELDPVVSSVTAKLKGVALTKVPGLGDVVWDVVDYSGPAQVGPGPGLNHWTSKGV